MLTSRRHQWILWSVFTACGVISQTLHAQVSEENDSIQEIQVTARRLLETRQSLMPSIGTSSYHLDLEDLKNLPLGDDAPLNEVLLRSPGVVEDSFGQIHIRGEHANVQYRINDVVLPESIALFGQSISPRLAESINLLTGALPAQYGYRTAGVVDIHTKGLVQSNDSELTATVGTIHHIQLAGESSQSLGSWSVFSMASLLENHLGIENPEPSVNAVHDDTHQFNGFLLAERELDDGSRLNVMLGESNNNFQIPNRANPTPVALAPNETLANLPALNENQHEGNRFAILSFENSTNEQLHYKVAISERFTDVHYTPDPNGLDLVFLGASSDIARSNNRVGLQADAVWRANDFNVIRFGLMASDEEVSAVTATTVYPLDANQNPIFTPKTIVQNDKPSTRLTGAYLQDEWHPSEQWTINGGLRVDDLVGQTHEQALSPRLGMVYDAGHGLDVHMGYARYFTPPPSEKVALESVALFADTTNAPLSTANDPVRAERSHYFDLGLLQNINSHWSVGLDAYFKRSSDLLDEGQFGNALVFAPFNYADGQSKGLELSTSWHHADTNMYANVTTGSAYGRHIISGQYNFGLDELAVIQNQYVHLDHDEKIAASAGASTLWLGWHWSVDGLYGSGLRSGFVNSDHLPSHTSVNISARHEWMDDAHHGFTFSVSVINLLDQVYELRDGTGIGVGAPQYGQRQTLYISLSRRFG